MEGIKKAAPSGAAIHENNSTNMNKAMNVSSIADKLRKAL